MSRWHAQSSAEPELFFQDLISGGAVTSAPEDQRLRDDLFFADLTGLPLGPRRSRQASTRIEAEEQTTPPATTATDITRWDIFVPVSEANMRLEAAADIDPLTVRTVEPSWRLDGLAELDRNSPSHFIARKMGQLPQDRSNPFDTRVYYCHPLVPRFYGYPDLNAMTPAASRTTPWYNQRPSSNVPLMGVRRPATTSNRTFQQLLTAVNKRLVKAWMGELTRALGTTSNRQQLADWFASDDGRNHFRQWCQALGTQGGDRGQGNSAHGNGKAIDMNYDHNPWVPLCSTNGRTMSGEDFGRTDQLANYRSHFGDPGEVFRACGRIYDRALRLFVPLVTSATDPNGTRHFSSTYYRHHHDWTPTRAAAAAPPYTADQVFNFYQVLSWSLRFYFDYAYGQCSVVRTDQNVFSRHTRPDPLVFWQRIERDWTEGRLPPTAELHVVNRSSIPAAVRDRFDEVTMQYSFQTDTPVVARFRLQTQMAQVRTDAERTALGTVVLDQVAADHEKMRGGMVTVAPNGRDPCNGVFNHSYEAFLAFCYMLSDPDTRRLRAFGSFGPSAGGDMQHFDYGYRSRV
jgi:hypothetical protein